MSFNNSLVRALAHFSIMESRLQLGYRFFPFGFQIKLLTASTLNERGSPSTETPFLHLVRDRLIPRVSNKYLLIVSVANQHLLVVGRRYFYLCGAI